MIETERLILRAWTTGDIDALHALWTDPLVRRYLWDGETISRERAAGVVQAAVQSDLAMWIVERKGENGIAGFCGFRAAEDGEIELLYGLSPRYWGQGLATEAARAALGYFWEHMGYRVVIATADAPNRKSVEVMKRLGMHFLRARGNLVTYILERRRE